MLFALFALPETAIHMNSATGQTAQEIDTHLGQHASKASFRKAYRSNLFYVRHAHVQGGGMKQWITTLLFQFEYIIDPLVLAAVGIFGICLGW